jgi:transposase-like protein
MGKQKFSRSLKRSICIEYMQSGKSRKEIAMKYNLPSVGTLSGWINSCLSPLEIHEKCASLQPVTIQMDSNMAQKKEDTPMDVATMSALIEAQKKQIAKLEKDLKYSQDKNLALNTLIDVIEEQGIKVRKKAGVKQ